jgi:hypothetical protein
MQQAWFMDNTCEIMLALWELDEKFQLKFQIDQSCDSFYIPGGNLKKNSLNICPSETAVELGE